MWSFWSLLAVAVAVAVLATYHRAGVVLVVCLLGFLEQLLVLSCL
jgi:hypothetical protein